MRKKTFSLFNWNAILHVYNKISMSLKNEWKSPDSAHK